ncbi:MAG: DUF2933 domain-containing protein [Hydrogenophaga sp.]|nr:DUF2933 domain-containing protein [Hydrogenophaga sp.]MDP3325218.1 DUF2933 domain-containing protein [Hydrogenophaga sp.]
MKHPASPHAQQPKNLWRTRYGVGLLVLGAVAAFFLLAEHRAHLFGVLPFLLILACPLMHLFMHRRHGAHGHHGSPEQPRTRAEEPAQANPRDRS